MICRGCHQETGDEVLVDLGEQPLANRLVSADPWEPDEVYYPLAPVICKNKMCRLIQLPELPDGVGFGADYPYRSGQSRQWISHCTALIDATWRSGVARSWDCVVEVGGNDGTFGEALWRYCDTVDYLNVDPSADPDDTTTIRHHMGLDAVDMVGRESADWVVALNVAAHVPDLDDFFAGIRAVMKDDGLLTVEVQDVNQLIERGEWDCLYHEHYSYFNKQTLADAIERRGFYVEKYEDIPTHGGSIRLTARKIEQRLLDHPPHRQPLRLPKPYPKWPPTDGLSTQAGMCLQWADEGRRVVGYGAPAKAMTWLNSYGVKLAYIVDSTPEKQGKYTPGSHIEISSPRRLEAQCRLGKTPPDIVVILAWNWADEILPKIPAGPEVWCRGKRLR